MMVEAADYLTKAKGHLRDARTIAGIFMYHVAAREAYLAAFHAAEAYVFARTGKAAKTHRGLRVMFNRLAVAEPRIPHELVAFLAQGYEIKSNVDYDIDPATPSITDDIAVRALDMAQRFIEVVESLLRASPTPE